MKSNIYAVRDLKVGFMHPQIESNNGSAIRNFEIACNNPNSLFHTHPEDFQLFEIGTYDTDTGVFENLDKPNYLVSALDFKKEV